MLIQKESNNHAIAIKSYRPGVITIQEDEYKSPILVSNSKVIRFDKVEGFDNLNAKIISSLIQPEIEMLILGSGEHHQFLPMQEMTILNKKGIPVECMNTRNACHTFQVLTHENRKIIGLLFP